MKKKHVLAIGALTLCGSLLVAVPSSFAVKSMGDKEMDATSAAGQSRIDIGDGSQTINDGSTYGVDIKGQGVVVGGSIVNLAGENNVAVGVNVVNMDTADSLDQQNVISQQRNAQLTVATATAGGIVWSDGVAVQSGLTGSGVDGNQADNGIISGGITVDNITASADHIKVGHGNQTENDSSVWTVLIDTGAQDTISALSSVNAAGRNNIAVGINAANSDQLVGAVSGISASTISTISQLNTFIQQN